MMITDHAEYEAALGWQATLTQAAASSTAGLDGDLILMGPAWAAGVLAALNTVITQYTSTHTTP